MRVCAPQVTLLTLVATLQGWPNELSFTYSTVNSTGPPDVDYGVSLFAGSYAIICILILVQVCVLSCCGVRVGLQ